MAELKTPNEFFTVSVASGMELGDEMKKNEKKHIEIVEPHSSIIIRVDQCGGSKFTSNFPKPDCTYQEAMRCTMNELMQKKEFRPSPSLCYTHSDEITVIFPALCTKKDFDDNKNSKSHPFNGRTSKLMSLLASIVSVRFNFHIQRIYNELPAEKKSRYSPDAVKSIMSSTAYFDARILVFPEDEANKMIDHMIWRSIFDCNRNMIFMQAKNHYTQEQLHGKNSMQLIEMLKEKNIDYMSLPLLLRHGIYAKRMDYYLDVNNGKNSYKTKKTKVINFCLKITHSKDNLELLTSSKLNEEKFKNTCTFLSEQPCSF